MKTQKQIIAPLLVMLLLTLLAGGTAYLQILSWKNGVTRVANHVSELVILNNIHWGLQKVQKELKEEHSAEAQSTWQELQKEARVLSNLPLSSSERLSSNAQIMQMYATLSSPEPDSKKVGILLHGNFLQLNLNLVKQLNTLEDDAELVTRLVTAIMIALGLVLAAVTVTDVDKLFKKITQSRDLNIQLQEEERRRIAQELHDGVMQELIDLKRQYSPDKVEQVIGNLRRVCHNLKPQILEDLGLTAALQFLADDLRQSGIETVKINLDTEGLNQLPKSYELPLFRVIQELCSNLKRHAQASRVNMAVSYNPKESPVLSGYVSDNGQGFDPKQIAVTSMGLAGIRERIQQMDGELNIHSQPGQGTQFQWTIPVRTHA